MNILALTSAYPQPDDGKEVVTPTVKYFCEKWAETGHNVIVVHNNSCFPKLFYMIPNRVRKNLSSKFGHNLPTAESRKELHRVEHNVSIYRIPIVKIVPHGMFSAKKINKQIQRIKKILENECFIPDVIIAHWVNPQIELLSALGKYYGAKTSLVFHDDCSQKNIERFDLIQAAKELDAIGCRNRSYAERVQEALHLEKTPFICYSGIPDELAAKCEKELETREFVNTPEFIYVGRLVKYKNVDTILEALHHIYQDRPFKFHIVGSGAEQENLEQMVEKYQMKDRVIFHGQVSREEAFALMQTSTYFVMVSDHETFGMVYIEAMLAGCITIAAQGGGVDGVIVDGENGFLSQQGNINELVKTIEIIEQLSDYDLSNLRRKATLTALEYSDNKVSQKYIDDVLTWKDF